MKKIVSFSLAICMIIGVCFSLASCSKSHTEMTEENINFTVETVETALKEFDTKTLEKYVDSQTLTYILDFAKKHEQYVTLGKAIFENMDINVEEIDANEGYVTISVSNKRLDYAAGNFASELLEKYSTVKLLAMLNQDSFLDTSLNQLVNMINEAELTTEATVKLKVKRGDKNLVLCFDEEAENAVSGGALSAITGMF